MRRNVILIMILLMISALGVLPDETKSQEVNPFENLIRFHVIANSDDTEDQDLKLKVRDSLLDKIKEELEDARSINEAYTCLVNKLDWIEEVTREEVVNNGYDYSVKVLLGNTKYPTRTYGNYVLPAGTYLSLRIIIGNGEGANWWCVLFPPLCFVDITNGKLTVPDKAIPVMEEQVKDGLHEKPVKIKLKLLEILKEKKTLIKEVFSKGEGK
ncbi:MAG: stage II sporulation protein R [Bacillota bacterium]